jgi:UDP-N-acetylmuramoyl-tripeptide--D-alanyl-D-alanine ligase
MAELGAEAETWHRHAGKMARSMGIEELYTIGELAPYAAASFGKGGQHLSNGRSLIQTLRPRLHTGVTLLVKGSRCMAMEHIVSQLLKCDP